LSQNPTSKNIKNIKKVHEIISNDRKVKLIEIAETLKISKKRVEQIVHEYLDMLKLFAKWLPHLLQLIKSNNILMIRSMLSDIQA
jgi:SHS2 domain-containing protein